MYAAWHAKGEHAFPQIWKNIIFQVKSTRINIKRILCFSFGV
jgi:hypothetical protein